MLCYVMLCYVKGPNNITAVYCNVTFYEYLRDMFRAIKSGIYCTVFVFMLCIFVSHWPDLGTSF